MSLAAAAKAGTIKIGDIEVNRIGLGTNRIHDNEEGHVLLKRAAELGINFIDTAHSYTSGDSETSIGNALFPYQNGLVITTKGGYGDASPGRLRAEFKESLNRLKTDTIDLYQLHRIDPSVPLQDSLSVLKEFKQQGKLRHIGLSEVSIEQLEQAMKIVPIVSVQNEYSIVARQHEKMVDYCTENNIVFIPWFPLGGVSGDGTKEVEQIVHGIADKYNATPQQIALAWLLKRSPMMLPIPGTTSIKHLESNLRAAEITLDDEDYEYLLNI